VKGLADIIDDDDEDGKEKDPMANVTAQEGQGDEEDNVEIDLENPEDVRLIEEEFNKLINKEQDLKNIFGDEVYDLDPIVKYQIMDLYNTNGMEAVIAHLTNAHADPN
jgi:hypothetical protein